MKNILWLHDMGDPKKYRTSVRDLEFMLKRFSENANVLVHDARINLPKKFADPFFWDGIVLGPTFLCNRYSATRLNEVEKRFGWIRESNAKKIALPQDDYDCSQILDKWLVRWGVGYCFTPIVNHWDIIYPEFSNFGEIKKGFTAYLSKEWIKKWSIVKPSEERSIDISYRASKLPANFGSLGVLKSEVAEKFLKEIALLNSELVLDISCEGIDVIHGDKWHDFLENSKFTLATPSGSSLIDSEGKIRECVQNQSSKKNFLDIAEECFPGLDNLYRFDCIGPRHIEAALAGTVQIATKGFYSGLFEEDKHYIPLEEDCSNLIEVLSKIQNRDYVNNIQVEAKNRILTHPDLYLDKISDEILNLIGSEGGSLHPNIKTYPEKTKLFFLYNKVLNIKYQLYWSFKRKVIIIVTKLKNFNN